MGTPNDDRATHMSLPFSANGHRAPSHLPPQLDIRSISIGGGVQSAVMSFMAHRGHFGSRPDVGCPLHATEEWAELGRLNPEEVKAAARVEAALQEQVRSARPGAPVPWLHRRRVPLSEAVSADIRLVAASGERRVTGSEKEWNTAEGDLWAAECDGVCGT